MRLLVTGMLIGIVSGVQAQDRPSCWEMADIVQTPRMARVISTSKRLHLIHGDQKNCPSDSAACRQKAYVLDQDQVIAGAESNGFVCVAVPSKGSSWPTFGFLPASALNISEPVLEGWSGTWGARESTITITPRRGGAVMIEGSATYGRFDKERVRLGGVNTGEIEVEATPDGDGNVRFGTDGGRRLGYDKTNQTDCMVRMARVGPFLVVDDNLRCGGHNVTFRGLYRPR